MYEHCKKKFGEKLKSLRMAGDFLEYQEACKNSYRERFL